MFFKGGGEWARRPNVPRLGACEGLISVMKGGKIPIEAEGREKGKRMVTNYLVQTRIGRARKGGSER